jgi:8-oxo-dGTP pyrophosphatase MutT (NUDIX family)
MNRQDITARIRPHLGWPASIGHPIYGTSYLSSVIVLIHFTRLTPHILLTKRSTNLKAHTGEVSFPGGKFMKEDGTLLNTALRETAEEIGIKLAADHIIGCLNAVKTLTSNYYIVPFVSIRDSIDPPTLFAGEVEAVLDIPLLELLSTMAPDTEHVSIDELYKFEYDSYLIWGATARILKQLNELILR